MEQEEADDGPCRVCVLPLPVAPYAMIKLLCPFKNATTAASAVSAYTSCDATCRKHVSTSVVKALNREPRMKAFCNPCHLGSEHAIEHELPQADARTHAQNR